MLVVYSVLKKNIYDNHRYLLLFLIACIFLSIGMSGTRILSQGDEYMHIATVRESLLTGHYLLPQLDGLPNYFKPPLLFWFGMISETIFGHTLFAIRLPALIAGVGTALVLFSLLSYLKVSAFFPTIIYLLCLGAMKFSRLFMMEQFLALALLSTAYLFIRFIKTKNFKWLFFSGLIASIAYFYKGPLFQVYTGFLLLAYFLPQVLRYKKNGPLQNRKKIQFYLKAILVFHVSLIIPILWNFYLMWGMQNDFGKTILHFFFVNENLSKFSNSNQSEGLILLGWLMYTFPWTIVVAGIIIQAFRSTANTPNRQIAKLLLVTVLSITLLHLLPNRKDPYYIIPILPLLMASLPLISRENSSQLSIYIKINFIFLGIVSLIFLAIGIYLELNVAVLIAFASLPLIHFMLVLHYKKLDNNLKKCMAFVVSGALVISSMQFLLIPAISLPLIPDSARKHLSNDLCIISKEPWDGFAIRMLFPNKKIQHRFPGDKNMCQKLGQGIIVLDGSEKINPYAKRVITWKRWKEKLVVGDVIRGLGNIEVLKKEVVYYEVKKDLSSRQNYESFDKVF